MRSRMRQNRDLIAEMGVSASIGAYTWWMGHPDAAGVEEAKRWVERAITAIAAYLIEHPKGPFLVVDEQLAGMGVKASDIDAVLLTHLRRKGLRLPAYALGRFGQACMRQAPKASPQRHDPARVVQC